MKKIVKKLGMCLIVYIVITMTVLSNISQAYTVEEVGAAVAGYAKNLLEWGNAENLDDGGPKIRYSWGSRNNHPSLKNGTSVELPWYYDCSSFASSTYDLVCGMNLFGGLGVEPSTGSSEWNISFEVIGYEGSVDLQPGDVIINRSCHVEIYIGDEYGSGGGHSNGGDHWSTTANAWQCYYYLQKYNSAGISDNLKGQEVLRLKEEVAAQITDLNTEFTLGTTSSTTKSSNLSNFYFNGIPDGKYSVASTNVLEYLLDALSSITDYIIGILTYGIRIVVVGWTAAIHQWITNAANEFFYADGTSSTDGISSVEIDSAEYTLTIEDIVYNTFEALDVNIFKND